MSRLDDMPFGRVYPLYVAKVERKGRSRAEVDEVVTWLTGYDQALIDRHVADGTTFRDFFAAAELNPRASLVTGVICGVRIEALDDELTANIRRLDKLVDEIARGRPMAKVLRPG
ncbi:DUF2200 domain-containing protein [Frigoribacterium sp. SL97]|uniref:DUF2200 domain-containing protein n=1 Tax=Frigoribacterium sp. SL97 TaxID=2994664 RepID=UPI00226FD6E6|nr:DUF2200 domain-containing protein [Frigoribacterium sp. SL97]WAC52179.1 DUF2200 domain-containing protein [Frigoribacterium sp. SL97]